MYVVINLVFGCDCSPSDNVTTALLPPQQAAQYQPIYANYRYAEQ